MSTASAESPLVFKTSSCHKNRKGWLGGLVVFGVLLFMGNKLFLSCYCRPAAESVPLLSSTWIQLPVDRVDFLQHTDSPFSSSAEKQHLTLLVPWDPRQLCYMHVHRSGLWTRLACCTGYDLIRCICQSSGPTVVMCHKSFDSAWILKNEDIFIHPQVFKLCIWFFFLFALKYHPKYICTCYTMTVNALKGRRLISIENSEATIFW